MVKNTNVCQVLSQAAKRQKSKNSLRTHWNRERLERYRSTLDKLAETRGKHTDINIHRIIRRMSCRWNRWDGEVVTEQEWQGMKSQRNSSISNCRPFALLFSFSVDNISDVNIRGAQIHMLLRVWTQLPHCSSTHKHWSVYRHSSTSEGRTHASYAPKLLVTASSHDQNHSGRWDGEDRHSDGCVLE